ncbi:MAG: cytochrome c oxidase subunit II [Magnetococcales bacterium]|nr:cytochrome c oxidase subunit II [Magnetococcales bacterium]
MSHRVKRLGAALAMLMVSGAGAALAAEVPVRDPAASVDHLWYELLIDITLIGLVFLVLGFYWVYKYRAKSEDEVGTAPQLSSLQSIAWILVPSFLFMADDFFLAAKGWTVWNIFRQVPANAMEVKVTGSMWNWQFQYDNGATSTYEVDSKDGDGLVVPVGRPVVLRMTSTDVVHSFSLPEYRVKEDLMPGRVTYLWFYPKKETKTLVTCTEYCGNRHSYMYAPVKVVPQAEFDTWMASKKQAT